MKSDALIQLIISGGLLSGIGYAYKAWVEHRVLKASADTTATTLVIEAARELVDPLRRELAEARKEARAGVEAERAKLADVRAELAATTAEARELRAEIAALRAELAQMYRDNAAYRQRITDLERT